MTWRQVGEVDGVAQRGDQPVDGVLQPGQDAVARRTVHGDRHLVDRFRCVTIAGEVVADQRRQHRACRPAPGRVTARPTRSRRTAPAAGRIRRGWTIASTPSVAGPGCGQRWAADAAFRLLTICLSLVAQPDQAVDVPMLGRGRSSLRVELNVAGVRLGGSGLAGTVGARVVWGAWTVWAAGSAGRRKRGMPSARQMGIPERDRWRRGCVSWEGLLPRTRPRLRARLVQPSSGSPGSGCS